MNVLIEGNDGSAATLFIHLPVLFAWLWCGGISFIIMVIIDVTRDSGEILADGFLFLIALGFCFAAGMFIFSMILVGHFKYGEAKNLC